MRHTQGGGDFGLGIQSTSHIDPIWNTIKGYIKQSYHTIYNKNVLYFVKEVEFKFIIRN